MTQASHLTLWPRPLAKHRRGRKRKTERILPLNLTNLDGSLAGKVKGPDTLGQLFLYAKTAAFAVTAITIQL